ncbi:MAG: fibronectin type III domain-containing protein [Lewinella sp.]
MNIRIRFLLFFFALMAGLSAQDFNLETKATASGTELLVWANNLMALRSGLQSGFTIEATGADGTWRQVTPTPLRASYQRPEEVKGQDISQGERYLYRFVLFPSEEAVRKVEGGRLLTTIYRRLAEDRAGLQASGLWAKDENNPAASSYRLLDAGGAVLATSPAPTTSLVPACSALRITPENNDQFITLSWPNNEQLAGYYLLKSVAGGSAKRFGDELIAYRDPGPAAPADQRHEVTILDTLPADGKTYAYQLVPVDHFGEVGAPCPASTIIGKDLIPLALPVVYPAVVNATTSEVQLRWDNPEGERPTSQRLLFAATQEGGYEELAEIPVGTTTFKHQWAAEQNRGFYRVEMADAAGNTVRTGPVFALRPDIVPPAVPQGFRADLVNGIVTLSWQPLTEKNVGYRLRTRTGGSDRWTEIMRYAPVKNETYDTLQHRLNGGTIEYQLSAYDWIGNESAFGEVISVVLPDNVPPAAPVITGLRSVKDSIGLGWRLALPEEVATIAIEVATDGENNFTEVRRLPAAKRQLLLTEQTTGTHTFRLQAEDAAGNKSGWSATRSVTVLQPSESLTSGIRSITHRAFAEGRILLQWQPTDEDMAEYFVYRQKDNEKASLAGTTATTQFSDLAPAGTSYFLVRQSADGRAFAPSETYTIK